VAPQPGGLQVQHDDRRAGRERIEQHPQPAGVVAPKGARGPDRGGEPRTLSGTAAAGLMRARTVPVRPCVRVGNSRLLNSRTVPIVTSSGPTALVGPCRTVVALTGSDL
jgi:hypothetical protein